MPDSRNLHITIGAILMMIFNISSGQDASVWFEESATWHYGYGEGMEARTAGYEKLEVTDDTVINSIDYRIIKRIRVYSNEVLQELDNLYLRYDSEKDHVYRYIDSAEYLLYDFSAEKGDTIIVKAISGGGDISFCHLVVDSIMVEVFSDSIQRRVQYCTETQNYPFIFGGKIIEGIGSEFFFFPVDQLVCDAGCAASLRCYQDSKVVITNPYIECDGLVTSRYQESSLLDEIKVYPNPAKGNLYFEIQSSKEVDHLKLLDQKGRVSYFSKNSEYIDFEKYNAGVYLLKAVMSDQSVIIRKIIKN